MPIRVSAPQLDTFALARYRDFEDRMLAFLRTHYGDELQLTSDAGVRAMIRDAVQVADGYGIVGEQGMAYVVLITQHLGRDFDLSSPAAPIVRLLRDAELPEESRGARAFDLAVLLAAGEPIADEVPSSPATGARD